MITIAMHGPSTWHQGSSTHMRRDKQFAHAAGRIWCGSHTSSTKPQGHQLCPACRLAAMDVAADMIEKGKSHLPEVLKITHAGHNALSVVCVAFAAATSEPLTLFAFTVLLLSTQLLTFIVHVVIFIALGMREAPARREHFCKRCRKWPLCAMSHVLYAVRVSPAASRSVCFTRCLLLKYALKQAL